MSEDRREIKKIEEELEKLSEKHLELVEAHRQSVKSYEQQKTLYQHFFGQPPLPPNPKLQALSSKIVDLKQDKSRKYDILQAAASIPLPPPLFQSRIGPTLLSLRLSCHGITITLRTKWVSM